MSLSSQVAKIVNKMILNKIDSHLRPSQKGFRPGKSTAIHIFALRRLIEEVKKANNPIC